MPGIKELKALCPPEVMLVSWIISLIFIAGKTKGAQNGLKEPADLKKIQTTVPRNLNEEHRSAFGNRALTNLKEINPFYSDVVVGNS